MSKLFKREIVLSIKVLLELSKLLVILLELLVSTLSRLLRKELIKSEVRSLLSLSKILLLLIRVFSLVSLLLSSLLESCYTEYLDL